MKHSIIFLLSVIVGTLIMITAATLTVSKKEKTVITPLSKGKSFSLLNPPSDSITGNVTILTGEVDWQSRIATIPATITTLNSVQQGEEIETQEKTNMAILFLHIGSLTVSPNTHLSFVQTMPNNFVTTQYKGSVTYAKLGQYPLSIRTLHMLTSLNGRGKVDVDPDNETITITLIEGDGTVAFNDLDVLSNVVSIQSGDILLYDDRTRTTKIEHEKQ
jgi:hypothetical protein